MSPSRLFRWRKLTEEGSLGAVHADESGVPISQVQALDQQVEQLQRLLGKKAAECKILCVAVEVAEQKIAFALAMIAGGRHRRSRCGRRPVEDPELIGPLRDLAAQRPTYGYRQLWALLRRLGAARGQRVSKR